MEHSKQQILDITQETLARAGLSVTVIWAENVLPRVVITSDSDLSFLIGPQGQTLSALEHLIRLASRDMSVVVDINDYRKVQVERLLSFARERAERVIVNEVAESLDPMNAFERKLIHSALSSFGDITTESIGTEPHRRVVIKPALKL